MTNTQPIARLLILLVTLVSGCTDRRHCRASSRLAGVVCLQNSSSGRLGNEYPGTKSVGIRKQTHELVISLMSSPRPATHHATTPPRHHATARRGIAAGAACLRTVCVTGSAAS